MIKYNFDKKLVLVLASSKGIGLELAKEFLYYGAYVAVCGRNNKNLISAKKLIESSPFNKNIKFFKIDLSKDKNIKKLHLKIVKSFKKNIDILINNSGGPKSKQIIQTTIKDWDYAINNNLKSYILMSKYVLPYMKRKKWGRIVNLTSATAKEPVEKMVLSNVTRAGVVAFSKTLSKEIKIRNITVNSILTGGVLTDRLMQLIKKNNKKNIKVVLKNITKSIPVQHIASTKEFIKIILFLCSEDASYVNGAAIPVDGGTSRSIF